MLTRATRAQTFLVKGSFDRVKAEETRKYFERQAAYEREKRKRREQGRDDDVKRPKQGVWKDDDPGGPPKPDDAGKKGTAPFASQEEGPCKAPVQAEAGPAKTPTKEEPRYKTKTRCKAEE